MTDSVDTLKLHARILHRDTLNAQPSALSRMRRLPELRKLGDADLPFQVKRRHCLSVIARELGFQGWGHAVHSLRDATTFGRLLYPPRCGGHTNIWCATYEDAQMIHAQRGGYLLAYQTQFFVVDDDYIRTLGLDPEDPDWGHIGRNWAEPVDANARNRLCQKVIEASLSH